jgi:ABC-2 type transport system ATP-binding protein
LTYENTKDILDAVDFCICFVRNDGLQCYGSSMMSEGQGCIMKKEGTVTFDIESLSLLPGKYHIDVTIKLKDKTLIDSVCHAKEFRVVTPEGDRGEYGVVSIPHTWKHYEQK